MKNVKNAFFAFLKEEDGATMVEYGLLAALIAVACMATIGTMATNLNGVFQTIASKLTGAGS